jgi:hypothetical protein
MAFVFEERGAIFVTLENNLTVKKKKTYGICLLPARPPDQQVETRGALG